MNQQPKIDSREGWTSASNALADSLCPGRHLAQAGLPDVSSDASVRGDKIHAALAQQTPGDDRHANRPLLDRLTVEERECYDKCVEIERRLVTSFFEKPDGLRELREQRYWARFRFNDKEYRHSGRADVVWRQDKQALIIDYKTGRDEVADSPQNMQLRDLACLVRGSLIGVEEVTVAIIQPAVTVDPGTLCHYGPEDLKRATKEMFDRVVMSNEPDQPRKAGEVQCKYCKATRQCAAYQVFAGQVTPPAMLTLLDVPMASWTAEQCARAAAALGPCVKLIEDIKSMLKERLEKDPASVPGWELEPGKVRESITDPAACFERFVKLGGTQPQFLGCITVAKAKLRSALSEVTGAKGKALDGAMQTITEGITEQSRTAPSLRPAKPVAEIK